MELGVVGRVVEVIDASEGKIGAWRIETWAHGRWINGGASLSEFFTAGRLSPEECASLGLPDDAEPPDNPDN
jgi:hypothetical protein